METTIEDNIIVLQLDKEITTLFKSFLEILEDVKKDHHIMVDKIKVTNPSSIVDASDCLSEDKYEQIRKRVLDKGNECKRNLGVFLSFFDCQVNQERVKQAVSNRKTIKKYVSNPSFTE